MSTFQWPKSMADPTLANAQALQIAQQAIFPAGVMYFLAAPHVRGGYVTSDYAVRQANLKRYISRYYSWKRNDFIRAYYAGLVTR